MARWLVNQKERQFAAQDMDELKQLAKDGSVGPYDMIQPPGATDWLYVCEVDGLKELAHGSEEEDEDINFRKKRKFPIPLPIILIGISGVFGALSYTNYQTYKAVDGKRVYGDGIALSELVVLDNNTQVFDSPGENAVDDLDKEEIVGLKGKRIVPTDDGKEYWYEVALPNSQATGFVLSEDLAAGFYLADSRTKGLYEQLYNPDQFIEVANTAWTRLDPDNPEQTTLGLMVTNKSVFDMTDLVVLTTLSDKNGNPVQEDELEVQGLIPANDTVWIGMLTPSAASEDEPLIMTDHHWKEEVQDNEDFMEWTWSETLNMLVEETGAISGRIELIQMRSIENPEKMN